MCVSARLGSARTSTSLRKERFYRFQFVLEPIYGIHANRSALADEHEPVQSVVRQGEFSVCVKLKRHQEHGRNEREKMSGWEDNSDSETVDAERRPIVIINES